MTLSLAELIEQGETPLTQADVDRFRADGSWQGRTIRSVLSDVAAEHPDRLAIVGYRSHGEKTSLTYSDLDARSADAANALAALGVGPGDVVAMMLPNWAEYPPLIFGCNELRAIYAGIPVAYGELQAAAILRRSKAKVLVIPRSWRGQDHLHLSRVLRRDLPALEHVVVVDNDGVGLADGERLWSSLNGSPRHGIAPGDPAEICYFGFTSGTTGEPKGAMHTHETLLHSAQRLAEHVGHDTFGDPMVQLVASPVGHHTGYEWGTLFTVLCAGTGVHVDRWDPEWGVEIIEKENVTTFFGAPTFLQDMIRTRLTPDSPLRSIVIAGSSVPRNLPAQAAAALGAYIAPAWGMTECSIIVSCTPAEPSTILGTDGSVFEGSTVRVVDSEDRGVVTGAIGELQVKAPSMFLGYFERPDATQAAFTTDGWFRTGDTASLDDNGWVSLRGRTKDIIIRGGENIPVTDIETLLFDNPNVQNAAVIGMPDERLGERACAVVVLSDGAQLDFATLCEDLLARGLSKHYLPERLVVLDELPMTQSGKIQKFRLRELVLAGTP